MLNNVNVRLAFGPINANRYTLIIIANIIYVLCYNHVEMGL